MELGRRRALGWSLGEGWGREPITPPLYVPSEEPSQATEEPGPMSTALASYGRQEEHDAVGPRDMVEAELLKHLKDTGREEGEPVR